MILPLIDLEQKHPKEDKINFFHETSQKKHKIPQKNSQSL